MKRKPTLVLDCLDGEGQGISVQDIDSEALSSLDDDAQAGSTLQSALRVRVVDAKSWSDDTVPDVLGRYEMTASGIRFIPLFPFDPEVLYQAKFDPSALELPGLTDLSTLQFSIPRQASPLPTVQHVFPTEDRLPENLLRFYVAFSNPMQRGRFDEQIELLGPDGLTAPDVLYRAPIELWDKSMQHLTVLLDPGRLKRGVGPNRELGSPLKVGDEYTLKIGAGMLDLAGRPLLEPFLKRFRVEEAVRDPVMVERWTVRAPAVLSRQPLALLFPRPLDWGLLSHSIRVESDGMPIEGRIEIDQNEKRWIFTPKSPWAAGRYRIYVAPTLEDVCGNDVMAAFDRPMRSGENLKSDARSASLVFHLE